MKNKFLSQEEVTSALKAAGLLATDANVETAVEAILNAVSTKIQTGVSVSVDMMSGIDGQEHNRIFAITEGFQINKASSGQIDLLCYLESKNY